MERTRYLIIGAGISGLSFANWIQSDDWLVLEGDDAIGGFCKTVAQDGFVWDYSGHFFHFKHPDIERYLVDRMGDQRVRTVVKDSRIYHQAAGHQAAGRGGQLIDFPFQKNIHQLPKDELIDCLYDLIFKPTDAPADNFRDMLYAKFGRSIADKFLIPYNEKLYATDLAALDVDAMGRFFPWADTRDIVGNFKRPDNASYNSTFTYPEGGAIQYVNALARDLDPARIRLGQRVVAIDLAARVATTASGDRFGFEHLISSAPFVRLLGLTGLDHDPSIYSWNKVLVFNLGFDRKGWRDVHWVYFAARELAFYRIGFYDNIFDTDRMSLYVEIGYPGDAPIDAATVDAMRARVLADLAAVGVVDGHRLVSHHHVVLDPAYVHITSASIADVAHKRRVLGLRGVHSVGRYGAWTYCAIEDNIVEARALAEAFNAIEA